MPDVGLKSGFTRIGQTMLGLGSSVILASTDSIQNVASISTTLALGRSRWLFSPTRKAMFAVPPPSDGAGEGLIGPKRGWKPWVVMLKVIVVLISIL